MKMPRGFGKNYFSLSAITATVNSVTLHQTSTRVQKFHSFGSFESEDEVLEEELEELESSCPQQLSSKACHCNCYFLKRTRKTLQLFFIRKKPSNYYQFLNSDISPPLLGKTII